MEATREQMGSAELSCSQEAVPVTGKKEGSEGRREERREGEKGEKEEQEGKAGWKKVGKRRREGDEVLFANI